MNVTPDAGGAAEVGRANENGVGVTAGAFTESKENCGTGGVVGPAPGMLALGVAVAADGVLFARTMAAVPLSAGADTVRGADGVGSANLNGTAAGVDASVEDGVGPGVGGSGGTKPGVALTAEDGAAAAGAAAVAVAGAV